MNEPLLLRAAVTGAAGFLGSHLVSSLRRAGADVLPLVHRTKPTDPEGARELADALREPALFEGRVVVHSAAVRHRYGASPDEYRASNVDLVESLLRVLAGRSPRFVHVSSVGVYGFPRALPIREDHPFTPVTTYSRTKVLAEEAVRRLAPSLGLEWVIVRPTIVYGRGDKNGMMDKMARMIRAGTYRIVGDGQNVLHHTYIDDIVDGIVAAMTEPDARDSDFILAGPETITLERLSQLVADALGRTLPRVKVPLSAARAAASMVDLLARRHLAFTKREPPINHEKLDVMTLPVAFDVSKARQQIQFRPRVGYEEGVRRTLSGHAS